MRVRPSERCQDRYGRLHVEIPHSENPRRSILKVPCSCLEPQHLRGDHECSRLPSIWAFANSFTQEPMTTFVRTTIDRHKKTPETRGRIREHREFSGTAWWSRSLANQALPSDSQSMASHSRDPNDSTHSGAGASTGPRPTVRIATHDFSPLLQCICIA